MVMMLLKKTESNIEEKSSVFDSSVNQLDRTDVSVEIG